MVFRIVIVLFVLFVLVPHEPDLGLPRSQQKSASEFVTAIRATITNRASLAVEDLRQYRQSVKPPER